MRVFATGRPMGTSPGGASARHAQAVTSTAASVGPYRLCSSTSGSTAKKRSWRSRASASPLHTTLRIPPHPSKAPASRKARSMEGTKCSVVIPSATMLSRR